MGKKSELKVVKADQETVPEKPQGVALESLIARKLAYDAQIKEHQAVMQSNARLLEQQRAKFVALQNGVALLDRLIQEARGEVPPVVAEGQGDAGSAKPD